MRGKLIDALEAAWELDPVRLEDKLWNAIADENQKIDIKSTARQESLDLCGLQTMTK